mgnify:CR=1 FL=1
MYTPPSSRRVKKKSVKPNLIPILDAVFIFIFFLLMSANFVKIYEIPSDVPIVSDAKPPRKPPFSLTLTIEDNSITLRQGVAGKMVGNFKKDNKGDYDIASLRNKLIRIKKRYKSEKTIIFEPKANIEYEDLIKVMDAVRMLKRTDETLFRKVKGVDTKIKELFSNIVFGNIQS